MKKTPQQQKQASTFLFYTTFLLHTFQIQSSSYIDDQTMINPDSILLLNFKSSIPQPSLLSSWLPDHDPCVSFNHITCDNNHVSSIDLTSLPLNSDLSSISSYLLPLHSLSSLSFKSTNITTSSPRFNLTSCSPSLSSLDLSMNTISSDVWDLLLVLSSCSNLNNLNLSGNHLTLSTTFVPTPSFLSWFNKLEILDLSFNSISELFSPPGCAHLKHFSLRGNKAAGDITQISNCKSLVFLDVSSNRFNACISSFYDLHNLQHLDLSDNDFCGEVGDRFADYDQLRFLNLSSNRFRGDLPVFSNSGSLQTLDLSWNSFGGILRGEKKWDFCGGLLWIDLSFNKFYGFIPSGIGSCSSLETVHLSGNSLTGDASGEGDVWREMKRLRRLVLSNNSFNGGIPRYLPEILTVEYLDLSSNNLTGSIPDMCGGGGGRLKEVYLQNNGFSGGIPESLCNCTKLVSLDLSLNYLAGSIPACIGGMKNMRDLVAWMNRIDGEIPNELGGLGLLESLILDFNNLKGGIPKGLVSCTRLVWVSLSNNMLVGRIPSWIGRMSRLAILTLGNNSFSGEIPNEIGDCRSLVWLDLNSNLLVGSVPYTLFKQSGKIAAALFTRKRYAYVKNDGGDKGCHGAGNLLEFSGIRQEQLGRISAKSPCDYTRVYGGMTQPTFNHNGSLIFLDLSYNLLSSPIPREVGRPFYLSVLNLGHNNLSGTIPAELGALSSLNILDLSFNRLKGSIPSSLSRLSSLSELDLSNNLLEGPIPNSAQFDSFPEYKYGNNTGLCGFPLGGCVRRVETAVRRGGGGLWVGAVVVSVVAAVVVAAGLVVGRRRRGVDGEGRKRKKTEGGLMEVELGELVECTNGFEEGRKIGSGGFGEVYEGRLRDGRVVAVKRLKGSGAEGGEREFEAEVETIGRVSHKNVMRLLGYCRGGGERMLVYEYMKNGSVEEVVVDGKGGVRMGWEARRRVVEGAGRGLEYLHHRSVPRIIHRDMKSSNVLLDERMEARVSDFGMAREVGGGDTHRSVSTVVGTPGYVPPEYYQSCRCTTKGDVYSYGVVVVEVMTGRRATDGGELGEAGNLVGWVKGRVGRGEDVLDRRMVGGGDEEEMMDYLKVALLCVEDRPWKRPSMMEVMAMFREIRVRSGRMDEDEEDDGWP